MWILYASEIAACMGIHRYQKRHDVLKQVFKRIDQGIHWRKTRQLLVQHQVEITSITQLTQQVVAKEGLSDAMNQLSSQSTENHVQLNEAVKTFENTIKQRENELSSQQVNLQEKLSELTAAPQVTENTEQKIKEIQVQIKAQTTQKLQLEQVKQHLINEKITTYGRDKEQQIVQQKMVGDIKDNNCELFVYPMGELNHANSVSAGGPEWAISGRVDGFRHGVMIEIKNRKNKIFDPLPDYDYVQVQTYCQITDQPYIILIQCLSKNRSHIQRMEQLIRKDDLFWQQSILPRLHSFMQVLWALTCQPSMQLLLFSTPEDQQASLTDPWFESASLDPSALFTQTSSSLSSQDTSSSSSYVASSQDTSSSSLCVASSSKTPGTLLTLPSRKKRPTRDYVPRTNYRQTRLRTNANP
jgi:hypothetical protein